MSSVIPFPTSVRVSFVGSCWAVVIGRDVCWLHGDKAAAEAEAHELARLHQIPIRTSKE